ncbi:uncharacterized protein BO97DRAFT_422225 [Aspergillus homomorphus CBS 101889]|uniref:Uncharacterized protein n=1 Tax=Aspergillus homomorphus (strain CBS 101889) TaxID=1450537 RepID=A0A395I3T7_ASPHC|nr:hypothetical protein BO97DRAFT_422225 [Aspergillus homomorphus CBS 101889]RAL14871.1 hypothetical protein BO97DRAFT_422225 [Aspergillus homomorphus CBS 101889]
MSSQAQAERFHVPVTSEASDESLQGPMEFPDVPQGPFDSVEVFESSAEGSGASQTPLGSLGESAWSYVSQIHDHSTNDLGVRETSPGDTQGVLTGSFHTPIATQEAMQGLAEPHGISHDPAESSTTSIALQTPDKAVEADMTTQAPIESSENPEPPAGPSQAPGGLTRPPSYSSVAPPRYRRSTETTIEPMTIEEAEEGSAEGNGVRAKRRRCRCAIHPKLVKECDICCTPRNLGCIMAVVYICALSALILAAIILSGDRDNDPALVHDHCFKSQTKASYLSGFVGWMGADQWYAHHWGLAVFKSLSIIIGLVWTSLHLFIQADPPLDLDWLWSTWLYSIPVVVLWWMIDTVLWLKGVYSVPGCPGGGGV